MQEEKRKKNFFIIEAIAVLMLVFMCGCGTVTDIRQITSGGYYAEDAREYYDAKTDSYVTATQYDMNYFCDFWVKRVLLGVALLCLVGGFIYRRADHVNAVLRSKALVIEVGVPTLYILFAYGICYFADNFV